VYDLVIIGIYYQSVQRRHCSSSVFRRCWTWFVRQLTYSTVFHRARRTMCASSRASASTTAVVRSMATTAERGTPRQALPLARPSRSSTVVWYTCVCVAAYTASVAARASGVVCSRSLDRLRSSVHIATMPLSGPMIRTGSV